MVAKESVNARFERPDQGICYTEFSYMLLQAYDFLRLHVDHGCELQIGGSDQWGNITMGVELIRKVCGDEVYGLHHTAHRSSPTAPSTARPRAARLARPHRTSPYAMYQFFVNTPDEQVGQLLRFFTFLDHDADPPPGLGDGGAPGAPPAQKALARSVVALVHGEAEVAKCEEASAALFSEEIAGLSEEMLLAVTEDAPTTDLPRAELLGGGLSLVDAARPAPGWQSRKARPGARSTRAAPTSTTCARATPPAPSARRTCSTTATSCCARAATDVHILRAG